VDRRETARGVEGWYRATVTRSAAPDALWAVYLPRVNMNAAVWVNGQFVGDGGRLRDPISRNWNRPLLFAVPAGLLHAGANTVDVNLHCNRTGPGVLSPFRVGPAAVLRPIWEWQTFAQVTLAQIIGAATIGLGLLLAAVFWRRDPEGAHRWAALGVLVWSASFADSFVRDPPVSSRLWEWMLAVATASFVPCFVVAFHRALGVRRRWLEVALFAVPLVTIPAVAVLAPLHLFWAQLAGGAMSICTAIYLLLLVRRTTTLPDRPSQRLLMPAAIVGLLLGTHDVASIVTGHLLAGVLLSPYIPPLIILVSGGNLLAYLVRALDDSEQLNASSSSASTRSTRSWRATTTACASSSARAPWRPSAIGSCGTCTTAWAASSSRRSRWSRADAARPPTWPRRCAMRSTICGS